MLPRVACLCPTYGRPRLVQNALACFLAQDYPADRRQLLILDDAGQIASQSGDNWVVESTAARYPSLPAKYVRLVEMAAGADVLVVWDDDDVYLPEHISNNVAAMERSGLGWAHQREVWSDYSGRLEKESASGRFHGAVVVSRELHDRIGGWVQTPRADFDQQFIARLHRESPPAQFSDGDPTYIFRWASTGHSHCQGLMSSPQNTDWYSRVPVNDRQLVEVLEPRMDEVTERYFRGATASLAR